MAPRENEFTPLVEDRGQLLDFLLRWEVRPQCVKHRQRGNMRRLGSNSEGNEAGDRDAKKEDRKNT